MHRAQAHAEIQIVQGSVADQTFFPTRFVSDFFDFLRRPWAVQHQPVRPRDKTFPFLFVMEPLITEQYADRFAPAGAQPIPHQRGFSLREMIVGDAFSPRRRWSETNLKSEAESARA